MNPLVVGFMFMLSSNVLATEDACPKFMSPAVEAKLVPVLEARATARRLKIEWDKEYESAFEVLLAAKDKASQEARVALMDYYVGESYGQLLVCAVAQDSPEVRDLLELYTRCDIPPKSSVIPRDRTLPLREYALTLIRGGKAKESCTYE